MKNEVEGTVAVQLDTPNTLSMQSAIENSISDCSDLTFADDAGGESLSDAYSAATGIQFRTQRRGNERLNGFQRALLRSDRDVDFSDLIDSIGSELFAEQMLTYLHRSCGATRCALFDFSANSMALIGEPLCIDKSNIASRVGRNSVRLYVDGKYWQRDPGLREALDRLRFAKTSLVRTKIPTLTDTMFRENLYQRYHIRDRIVLCAGTAGSAIVLSVLRQDPCGEFSEEEISRICQDGETIMSIIFKHLDFAKRKSTMGTALSSLAMIVTTLASLPMQLSAREAGVCARILYGMSAAEISEELNVGLASVVTYRKRAYQKLNIGTHHELLMWYIGGLAGRSANECRWRHAPDSTG